MNISYTVGRYLEEGVNNFVTLERDGVKQSQNHLHFSLMKALFRLNQFWGRALMKLSIIYLTPFSPLSLFYCHAKPRLSILTA